MGNPDLRTYRPHSRLTPPMLVRNLRFNGYDCRVNCEDFLLSPDYGTPRLDNVVLLPILHISHN